MIPQEKEIFICQHPNMIRIEVYESSWNDKKHYSIYLNDYKIAGIQPMPGSVSVYSGKVAFDQIKKALPEYFKGGEG